MQQQQKKRVKWIKQQPKFDLRLGFVFFLLAKTDRIFSLPCLEERPPVFLLIFAHFFVDDEQMMVMMMLRWTVLCLYLCAALPKIRMLLFSSFFFPFLFSIKTMIFFFFFVFLLLDYSKHYFNDHSCFLPCFVLLINILISRTTKVSQLSWPRGEREEIISIKLLWIMSNA